MNSTKRCTAVVAHGGGPTHVLNASLAGLAESYEGRLLGGRFGFEGVLKGEFVEVCALDREELLVTPGSALGSSRIGVSDEEYGGILTTLKRLDAHRLFITGGNGTMYAALGVDRAARSAHYELHVIGIPKTIDNDLHATDHTPGYGSAARFFSHAIRDAGLDMASLPGRISIVEVMGRNVGWLTAATMLARRRKDDPPHLVYLPERLLSEDRFLADVETMYGRLGWGVIAVCEGQRNDRGEPIGDPGMPDNFGRLLSGSCAQTLARLIIDRLRIRARAEKPGLVGRSLRELVSPVDRDESRMCGRAAASVEDGGIMITLEREPGDAYRCRTGTAQLNQVAFDERPFPEEWIPGNASEASEGFLKWVSPLAGN
jgi:6-phosphofructokinase 1